jgi:hypothetical protein
MKSYSNIVNINKIYVMLKTSQAIKRTHEHSHLKSKDLKVKFKHYTSKEKFFKIILEILGTLLLIFLPIVIIISVPQGQFVNVVIYIIILFIFFIPIELIERKLKNNAKKRLIEGLIIERGKLEVPISYSTPQRIVTHKKENDILVFVSYATKDAEIFKIKEICESLTKQAKITDVLYWQEDMQDNIIKYMNDNLEKCDVMLLFCSPNALISEPVEKEWTAADIMGKPIIPIFNDPEHIPPLLKTRLGVKFDPFNFQKNLNEISSLILKKLK